MVASSSTNANTNTNTNRTDLSFQHAQYSRVFELWVHVGVTVDCVSGTQASHQLPLPKIQTKLGLVSGFLYLQNKKVKVPMRFQILQIR